LALQEKMRAESQKQKRPDEDMVKYKDDEQSKTLISIDFSEKQDNNVNNKTFY
jgi:hypothetical protein